MHAMAPRRSSLAVRLVGMLAAMLAPLIALAIVGVLLPDQRVDGFVLLGLLTASCLTAGLLAHRLHRHIIAPLDELIAAAKRVGGDDLATPITLRGDDELTQVAAAFNAMMERLNDSRSELVHQAFHDALTGLPNRELFQDRTQHALARAQATRGNPGEAGIAVLFLDLDDFKAVNDGLGHAAGDRLLTTVAQRLRTALRAGDTIARLGGDEFAVLLEDVPDAAHAQGTAERLLDALSLPVALGDHHATVGASIGVALSTGANESAGRLLRNADVAMYAAKTAGRGCHRIFEEGMYDRALGRMVAVEELRTAHRRGDFRLAYQPMHDLESGRVVAVEALLRWDHPDHGVIAPNDFIPLAEDSGLIVPIGRWVIQEACREAAHLQRLPGASPELTVSVNLSPRQLEDPGLVDDVAHALAESGIAPSTLVLELTESELTADLAAAAPLLFRLKALGVRLALDDIGTGYSRWSYLRSFPVDILKLDRELIASDDSADARLTRALLGLGRELELATVAEGIERPEQLDELRRMGCDIGQGYLFARPMDASQLAWELASAGDELDAERLDALHPVAAPPIEA